ncbi:MAG TPA: hypothetical protein VFA29_02380 [Candidatus Baltobacteraceae bacterium]|nr:hypothetical protein [Candidatus Baltobacteraceae bacterium]
MDLVRVHVTPLGLGYMAESRVPYITAMGTTAEEAAENARRQAVDMLRAGDSNNGMLIVRVSDAGRESIAMQSLLSRFTFRSAQMTSH